MCIHRTVEAATLLGYHIDTIASGPYIGVVYKRQQGGGYKACVYMELYDCV